MDTLVNLFKKIREIAGDIPGYLKMVEGFVDELINGLKASLIADGKITLGIFDPITATIVSGLNKLRANALNRLIAQGFTFGKVDDIFLIKLDDVIIGRYTTKENYTKAIKNILDKPKQQLDEYADAVRRYGDDADSELGKIYEKLRKSNPQKYWDDFRFTDFFPPPNQPKNPCFLAGTPVHTINGLKPIEKIETGDTVLCYDTEKQQLDQKTVSDVFNNHTLKYRVITTENGDANQSYWTTPVLFKKEQHLDQMLPVKSRHEPV